MNLLNKKDKKIDNEKVLGSKKSYSAFLKKAEVFATRYFDALVAVLVIIIFLLGVVFVINPKYNSIVEVEEYSQADLEAERSNLNTYINKLLEYRKAYQQLSDISVDRLGKVVPENIYLEDFFARLESITKKQGVIIKMMSINDLSAQEDDKKTNNKKEGELNKVEVVLSLSGVDYRALKKVLAALENNLRLMDVQSVKLNLGARTADLSIITYYLSD